jgi:hypothetical protein
MKDVNRDRLMRVARIYKTNKDAYRALGISPGVFTRLCREHDIETPLQRRRRCGRRPAA